MTPLIKHHYRALANHLVMLLVVAFTLFALLAYGSHVVRAQEVGQPIPPEQAVSDILAIIYVPIATGVVTGLTQIFKQYIPVSPVVIQVVLQAVFYVLWVAATRFNLVAFYESGVGFLETIIPLLPLVPVVGAELVYQRVIAPYEARQESPHK